MRDDIAGRVSQRLFLALALFAVVLPAVFAVPAARADRELPPGLLGLEVLNAAGEPDIQAGTHPDRLVTKFISPSGPESESLHDLEIAFPAGMGGNPAAIPTCARAQFDNLYELKDPFEPKMFCPVESQVGAMRTISVGGVEQTFPIYNLVPQPGEVAAFGVIAQFLRFKFSGHLRAGDLGLSTSATGFVQQLTGEPSKETLFEFWGVPADHQEGGTAPRRGFLTLPTRCDQGPLSVTAHIRSWEHPDDPVSGVADTGQPLTGCSQLPFAPKVHLQMDTPVAGAASGLGLDMEFPETTDVDGLASAQARSARIEFPEGMGISPGAAVHLTSCSDAQLAQGSETPASCPLSSKVGSVVISAPQLKAPLEGSLYLGAERPGERFRLFSVARRDGTETKFVGTMQQDPVTGRLGAIIDGLPPLSFAHLVMRFDGGPGALFVAPSGCGPATATATVTPYSGTSPVVTSDSVQIGAAPGHRCGEVAPFAPTLEAAVSEQRAGRPTTFTTLVTRRDGEQSFDKFSVSFPPGLAASVGSVEACSDAGVAAGSCSAASRLGVASVDVGTGAEVARLSGDAFLTGPAKGQPFGVAMIFNAAIGPFDLGTLSVRAGMKMDPLTGQVTVQTDSLPQSMEGLPIRFRAIELRIDRPGFMRTPTSCGPEDVAASILSTEGARANPTSTLSMRGCAGLPFRPGMSLALTDRKEMRPHGRPGLRMTMRARRGDANMKEASLSLPSALRFSPGALKEICTRRQALGGKCPPGSRVGSGSGQTTLLAKPMKGSIFVVQPQGNGEPDLWVNLRGEGIELNLRSSSRTVHGHTETGFTDLPDVPLGKFEVEFADHGVLSLRHGLCHGGRQRRLAAGATLNGHNGAVRELRVPVAVPKVCPAG